MKKNTYIFVFSALLLIFINTVRAQTNDSLSYYKAVLFKSLSLDSILPADLPPIMRGINSLDYFNGSVILSGPGFPSVISITAAAKGNYLPIIGRYEKRLQKGSRISIEGKFRNYKEEKPRPLIKTYIIKSV